MDYVIEAKPEAVVATGQKPLERPRRYRLHDPVFPEQRHRSHQRELALPGEGAHHADWRRKENAGLERSGGGREDQGLRQGREHHQPAKACTTCWSATAPAICGRRSWNRSRRCGRRLSYFVECISNGKDSIQRRLRRAAGGARCSRRRDESLQQARMRSSIYERVQLHRARREAGQETSSCRSSSICTAARSATRQKSAHLSRFRRTPAWARCKISSHTFICEGVTIEDNVFIGHGVTFINDTYPRATAADGNLQTEADWKVEKTVIKQGRVHRLRRDDSVPSHALAKTRLSARAAWSPKMFPPNAIVAGNPARISAIHHRGETSKTQ